MTKKNVENKLKQQIFARRKKDYRKNSNGEKNQKNKRLQILETSTKTKLKNSNGDKN